MISRPSRYPRADDPRAGLFTATIVVLIAALSVVSIAGVSLAAGLQRGERTFTDRAARRWAAEALAERTVYELEKAESWRNWPGAERREDWGGLIAVTIVASSSFDDRASRACLDHIGFRPRDESSLVLLAGVAIAGAFRIETATEYMRASDGAAWPVQRRRLGGEGGDVCQRVRR